MCRRNRDGSHATQADRVRSLTLAARQLGEAGLRQMRASSLKGRHVDALVGRWQEEGLSAGTMKNRLSHLRWWAEKIGKPGLIPADNARLGIPQRKYAMNENKAAELGDRLERVTGAHVRISLELKQAFGLRREESTKFQPRFADRGDHIALKGSWTKGGRERMVPITTAEQRVVLDQAHMLAGAGSLISAHPSYIQQRYVYDGQCKAAGLKSFDRPGGGLGFTEGRS
jgi:site-specific recombinase XerC